MAARRAGRRLERINRPRASLTYIPQGAGSGVLSYTLFLIAMPLSILFFGDGIIF